MAKIRVLKNSMLGTLIKPPEEKIYPVTTSEAVLIPKDGKLIDYLRSSVGALYIPSGQEAETNKIILGFANERLKNTWIKLAGNSWKNHLDDLYIEGNAMRNYVLCKLEIPQSAIAPDENDLEAYVDVSTKQTVVRLKDKTGDNHSRKVVWLRPKEGYVYPDSCIILLQGYYDGTNCTVNNITKAAHISTTALSGDPNGVVRGLKDNKIYAYTFDGSTYSLYTTWAAKSVELKQDLYQVGNGTPRTDRLYTYGAEPMMYTGGKFQATTYDGKHSLMYNEALTLPKLYQVLGLSVSKVVSLDMVADANTDYMLMEDAHFANFSFKIGKGSRIIDYAGHLTYYSPTKDNAVTIYTNAELRNAPLNDSYHFGAAFNNCKLAGVKPNMHPQSLVLTSNVIQAIDYITEDDIKECDGGTFANASAIFDRIVSQSFAGTEAKIDVVFPTTVTTHGYYLTKPMLIPSNVTVDFGGANVTIWLSDSRGNKIFTPYTNKGVGENDYIDMKRCVFAFVSWEEAKFNSIGENTGIRNMKFSLGSTGFANVLDCVIDLHNAPNGYNFSGLHFYLAAGNSSYYGVKYTDADGNTQYTNYKTNNNNDIYCIYDPIAKDTNKYYLYSYQDRKRFTNCSSVGRYDRKPDVLLQYGDGVVFDQCNFNHVMIFKGKSVTVTGNLTSGGWTLVDTQVVFNGEYCEISKFNLWHARVVFNGSHLSFQHRKYFTRAAIEADTDWVRAYVNKILQDEDGTLLSQNASEIVFNSTRLRDQYMGYLNEYYISSILTGPNVRVVNLPYGNATADKSVYAKNSRMMPYVCLNNTLPPLTKSLDYSNVTSWGTPKLVNVTYNLVNNGQWENFDAIWGSRWGHTPGGTYSAIFLGVIDIDRALYHKAGDAVQATTKTDFYLLFTSTMQLTNAKETRIGIAITGTTDGVTDNVLLTQCLSDYAGAIETIGQDSEKTDVLIMAEASITKNSTTGLGAANWNAQKTDTYNEINNNQYNECTKIDVIGDNIRAYLTTLPQYGKWKDGDEVILPTACYRYYNSNWHKMFDL